MRSSSALLTIALKALMTWCPTPADKLAEFVELI